MARQYHIFGETNVVAAEMAPHEKFARIRYVEWNRESNVGGVLLRLDSALDRRFSDERFPTADAAISFAIFRFACDWFASKVARISAILPRDGAMYRNAYRQVAALRPQTMEDARQYAVRMAYLLSVWGETAFPQQESLIELEPLLF